MQDAHSHQELSLWWVMKTFIYITDENKNDLSQSTNIFQSDKFRKLEPDGHQ